jgi:hemin uptake protein HemP
MDEKTAGQDPEEFAPKELKNVPKANGQGDDGAGDRGENAGALARLPKIIAFRELCRCGDEVWIENGGQLYRLRRTKQGKLILTK